VNITIEMVRVLVGEVWLCLTETSETAESGLANVLQNTKSWILENSVRFCVKGSITLFLFVTKVKYYVLSIQGPPPLRPSLIGPNIKNFRFKWWPSDTSMTENDFHGPTLFAYRHSNLFMR